MVDDNRGLPQEQKFRKCCFITIGATAPFDSLLSNVLDSPFLGSLNQCGYTDLVVQYGKEGRAIFDKYVQEHPAGSEGRYGLNISGFDFKSAGLGQEMRLAKGHGTPGFAEGMVLSHAGSGSILEALRVGVPLVVVPNSSLQGNHQKELAVELSRQGYAIMSDVVDIPGVVSKAEDLRDHFCSWPPVNSSAEKDKSGLAHVMADEMGFMD